MNFCKMRGCQIGENGRDGFEGSRRMVRYIGNGKVVCGVSYCIFIVLKNLYILSKTTPWVMQIITVI